MTAAKSIIEIQGIKMEVDHRTATATKIETLKVGQKVKLLRKGYSDSYTVHPAVVIGFDAFASLPTIQLMYLASSYGDSSINYLAFNAQTKDVEMILDPGDVFMDMKKESVVSSLLKEVTKAEAELEAKKLAVERFQKYFGNVLNCDELFVGAKALV